MAGRVTRDQSNPVANDYLGALKEQASHREWRSSLGAKWWKEPSADDESDQGNIFQMR